ncbi:MAG: S24 family peptidase [Fusobacterium gastrosuis]|uniref:S24 family peptidase n=1 Tax=Fusobacterium gastrosuis TaxID=1755100 RepID=UPI001F5024EF|nr:S24 family peptidase [Fusobacterium gastrosuis]MDY4011360.1 S24 family peptidase [Fusobacterium gastrosuis]
MKEKDFELADELAKEIGEIFKNRREELKYSTNKIQLLTNIDKADLSRIENGKKRKINPIYIKELAKALKLDVIELFKKVGYLDEKVLQNRLDSFNLQKSKVNTVILPVYGRASAGNGYINLENEIYFMPVLKGNFSKRSFLVEIHGNSMYPTLEEGNFVLVDPDNISCEKNKIYVFTYDNESYIKRFDINEKNKFIILKSDNPSYDDIYISFEEQEYLKVEGRVLQVISNKYL